MKRIIGLTTAMILAFGVTAFAAAGNESKPKLAANGAVANLKINKKAAKPKKHRRHHRSAARKTANKTMEKTTK